MTDKQASCLYCKRTSQQVPLISVEYKDESYWICPEHLPILIHQPHLLAGILPGIETMEGAEHNHEH